MKGQSARSRAANDRLGCGAWRRSRGVSPEIVEREQNAITELGHLPNATAKALRQGNAPALGVIVTDLAASTISELVSGIHDRLLDEGVAMMLCSSEENPEREAMFLRMFAEQRVRGVLLAPWRGSQVNTVPPRDRAVPLLVMDTTTPPGDEYSCVGADGLEGAALAVNHLVKLGHRRLGTPVGPEHLTRCAPTGSKGPGGRSARPDSPRPRCRSCTCEA